MPYRFALLFFVCCAGLLASARAAGAGMILREVPLGHTAAWENHVALLRNTPSPAAVRPFRVSAPAASFAPAGRQAVSAGGLPLTPPLALAVAPPGGPADSVPGEWRPRIRLASRRHGVSPAVLAAVLKAESNFNSRAVSPKGALGAMQIMPATGRELGLRDFFDPEANLDAGAGYLAALLREFASLELALAAYNAGPEAVRRYGGVPPYAETRNYVAGVLSLVSHYSGAWR